MGLRDSMVGPMNLISTTKQRWYQFSLWHLFVATTILAAASAILAHMLKPEPLEVRGCVTMGGKPLSTGLITFVLADGKKTRRLSQRISNGIYAFSEGMESGVCFVEIRSPKATGDATVETIPAEYNSNTTLTAHLAPGSNFMDFDLNSR